jgi:chromosome segregation ATPase
MAWREQESSRWTRDDGDYAHNGQRQSRPRDADSLCYVLERRVQAVREFQDDERDRLSSLGKKVHWYTAQIDDLKRDVSSLRRENDDLRARLDDLYEQKPALDRARPATNSPSPQR